MEKESVSNDLSNWSTVTFSKRLGFSTFLLRLFYFFLFERTDMGRKIIRIRIPEFPEKIIKSTNTRSVPKVKSAEDSIKRINLKLGSPVSNGMDFKIDRQKVRTLHAGWSSWSRSKLRIFEFRIMNIRLH